MLILDNETTKISRCCFEYPYKFAWKPGSVDFELKNEHVATGMLF